MSQTLIKVDKLSLSIPVVKPNDNRLLRNPKSLFRDFYIGRSKRENHLLLDDISFELNQGERLGLIGRNGAGKSTLLRVLAGIYPATSGEYEVKGSIRGLFDTTLGMQLDATGLENIYLRGLQMGMSLSQVYRIAPEVVSFSELGSDINKLFHTYSAGMRLRLVASISTMINPDILLMDEWIGAGDASFRAKISQRMDDIVSNSKGMVLATHSIALMRDLCTTAIVLERGKIAFYGDVDDAYNYYQEVIL